MSRSLTISDDAYKELKAHRNEGESFSDAVKKLSKCGCGTEGKETKEKTSKPKRK